MLWKNPFGDIKGKEVKLDFGILYNMDEDESIKIPTLEITYTFPSNYCRNKITKSTESDNSDPSIQVSSHRGGRFTGDDNIHPQTLGHIHHEYEALSEIHTFVHHSS